MEHETITKLNQLNIDFYKTVGQSFDKTRNHYWPGWDKLIELDNIKKILKKGCDIKVLDIGCGNGRFGEFLKENNLQVDYTGLDSNEFLLSKAQEKLPKQNFVQVDLMSDNWTCRIKEKFDLIVIFGVMHHIPGERNRINIIQKIKKLLNLDGVLVFATWEFASNERLKKRIVYPTIEPVKLDLGLDISKLEKDDYILDWQRDKVAYRYCHNYTQEEVENIVKKSGLKIIETYLEDGKERNINKYWILKKD